MFVKVSDLKFGQLCQVIGYGHTKVGDDPRFRLVTAEDYIRDLMSLEGRRNLFGSEPPWSSEDIAALAEKWLAQTGIVQRIHFAGSVTDLAALAAKECLRQAAVQPAELDAIIGGTNTGPGYPSLADHVKLALGQESAALAYDVAEACPVGAIAVFNGWTLVRSGVCQKVLVVCAEKATTLTSFDEWKGANLFGDAAFAFLLSASSEEAFIFFDTESLPFGGQIDKIIKGQKGFQQDGNAVHKFVGRQVVQSLVRAVAAAGLSPAEIKHLVPHQPSKPTLDLLLSKLGEAWPDFRGVMHRNVEYTGNTSGASTGSLISSGVHSGLIKPNDLVVVTTFGSGLSIANYGYRVTAI